MPQGIYIKGGNEFAEMAKRLRGPATRQLRSELTKSLRAAAKPAVDDVKRSVRSVPVTSSHGGGTGQRHAFRASRSKTGKARARGLRDTIAAATGLDAKYSGFTTGVRIVVRSSGLPPDQRNLPRDLDKPGGWRHPVFGNRDHWVTQKGRPYFSTTIRKHVTAMRAEMIKALERTARKIAAS